MKLGRLAVFTVFPVFTVFAGTFSLGTLFFGMLCAQTASAQALDYNAFPFRNTVSLNLSFARSQERVVSTIQRDARATMKNVCNYVSGTVDRTVWINSRVRRFRLTPRVESMDLQLAREANGYSGTANVTFSCVLP